MIINYFILNLAMAFSLTKYFNHRENIRLFAFIDPALDVSKKELPVVHQYLKGDVRSGFMVFYQEMRKPSSRSSNDGVGKSPHFRLVVIGSI